MIKNTCTYLKDTKICVMRNSTKASPETGRISEVGYIMIVSQTVTLRSKPHQSTLAFALVFETSIIK